MVSKLGHDCIGEQGKSIIGCNDVYHLHGKVGITLYSGHEWLHFM